MAYARPLDQECTERGCRQKATYEVYNGRNETVRVCCRHHAEELVNRLSELERTTWPLGTPGPPRLIEDT